MRMQRTAVLVLASLALPGCTVSKFSQFGKDHFRITSVDTNLLNASLRFAPLADEINREMDQPVDILADWDSKSIQVHLTDRKDYYHLLYLDPVQFCQVSEAAELAVLAIRKNRRDETSEIGLIVVHKDSPIQTVQDLKGARFVFGPYDSPYMFYNVLELLGESKVPVSLLKAAHYSKDSLAVVQKLLFKWADAGVVTKTWWERTTDLTLDLSRPLKDDLRIIAETKPMPEYLWAATAALTAEHQAKLKHLLTEGITDKGRVLAPFEAKGFVPVEPGDVKECCPRLDRIKNLPPKPSLITLP